MLFHYDMISVPLVYTQVSALCCWKLLDLHVMPLAYCFTVNCMHFVQGCEDRGTAGCEMIVHIAI